MDEVELQAIFRGRVQGIGFRATARYHALKLGLTGYVRNLPDGSVDMCAVGRRGDVERLLKILQDEIFSDSIVSVETTFVVPGKVFTEFTITR